MNKLAFIAPTPEQYRQAVSSTFLTSKNISIIVLVFLVTFIILTFLKFLKSLLTKVLIAAVITGIIAFYLYLRTLANIRF